jgi:hypothetical protein
MADGLKQQQEYLEKHGICFQTEIHKLYDKLRAITNEYDWISAVKDTNDGDGFKHTEPFTDDERIIYSEIHQMVRENKKLDRSRFNVMKEALLKHFEWLEEYEKCHFLHKLEFSDVPFFDTPYIL